MCEQCAKERGVSMPSSPNNYNIGHGLEELTPPSCGGIALAKKACMGVCSYIHARLADLRGKRTQSALPVAALASRPVSCLNQPSLNQPRQRPPVSTREFPSTQRFPFTKIRKSETNGHLFSLPQTTNAAHERTLKNMKSRPPLQ